MKAPVKVKLTVATILSLLCVTGSFTLAQSTPDSRDANSTTPQLQTEARSAELPSSMAKPVAAADPDPYVVLTPVINPKPTGEHGPFVRPLEVRIETGVEITPNRTAISRGRQWPQQSRIAPVIGLQVIKWFKDNGVSFQSDWSNTDTRLATFSQDTWTMNRVSFDGEYVRRFVLGSWQPFVKAGVGGTVFISGHDRCPKPGETCVGPEVGMDSRLEEIVGAGIAKGRFVVGYDAHFFRNPDFGDHTWFPQRNFVSAIFIGVSDLRGKNARRRRD
jgi:hypothetical protein